MLSIILHFTKKTFIKNTSYYLLANIIKAIIPFLILPVLTAYLSPTEYGSWNVFSAILSFLLPLTAIGLTTLVGRNYHILNQTKHAEMTFISALIIVVTCLSTILLIYILSNFHSNLLGINITYYYAIPILCLFQNITYFYKIILRHENRALFFSLLEITNSVSARIGGLILIIIFSATWHSLLLAQLITAVVIGIYALISLQNEKKITLNWNSKAAKEYVIMGWPMMPHALGGIVMSLSDRIILQLTTTTTDVGIYSLAANLGTASLLFCTAFNNSWGPFMHRQLRNATEEKKIQIIKYTYLYFSATVFLSACSGLFSIFYIRYFIDISYTNATQLIWWIMGGSCLYSMSFAVTHYLIILGKMGVLPIITSFCALINIGLTFGLVSYIGIKGAAVATFISYCLFFILIVWQSQNKYPMPWLSIFKRKK